MLNIEWLYKEKSQTKYTKSICLAMESAISCAFLHVNITGINGARTSSFNLNLILLSVTVPINTKIRDNIVYKPKESLEKKKKKS